MKLTPMQPALSFDEQLHAHLDKGFKVISDGPTGIQLEGPKKMTGLVQGALIIGGLLTFVYGIGLIIVVFALIDYAMAKKPTVFLHR